MLVHKSYKFRLAPTDEQKNALAKIAGCCRKVWNRALNDQTVAGKGKEIINFVWLRALLEELPYLKQVEVNILNNCVKNFRRAIEDAAKERKNFPNFKKKGKNDAFHFSTGFRIEGEKVFLPGIGSISFRKSREIEGKAKNVYASRCAGFWFISIQTEQTIEDPIHPSNLDVGIDVGVNRLATLSDGTVIKCLRINERFQARLVRENIKLSRQIKNSKNWTKQQIKIQKIYQRMNNMRKDYLDKQTSMIAKKHSLVVLEDLKVTSLLRRKNSNEGRNFNPRLFDQSWHEFQRMLDYKLRWSGGTLVLVDPRFTSQRCSVCSYQSRGNRKTQDLFKCNRCGHTENADLNAAKNILAAGRAVKACGKIGRHLPSEPKNQFTQVD